jgi:repressor LexA
MEALTQRQTEVVEFINRFCKRNGYPPTRAEIAGHFGFKSPNAAEEHIKALARKGVLTTVPHLSRSINVVQAVFEQYRAVATPEA